MMPPPRLFFITVMFARLATAQSWPQWGRDWQECGMVNIAGQRTDRLIADIVYDPVVQQAKPDYHDELLVHYPAPIVDGDYVFMRFKHGQWVSCQTNPDPCGSDAWNTITWSVKRLHWESGVLVEKGSFDTDWLPAPGATPRVAWEPVFHPVLVGDSLYVPASAGGVVRLKRTGGTVLSRPNPL